MKKVTAILILMTAIVGCRHHLIQSDILKSDDLSQLISPQPADLDVKLYSYYSPSQNNYSYGILDQYNRRNSVTDRKSLVTERKLVIDNTVVDWPQNNSKGNQFTKELFKNGSCVITCKGLESAGYGLPSQKLALPEEFSKFVINPSKHISKNEDISLDWNPGKNGNGYALIILSFDTGRFDFGIPFQWNKIVDDNGHIDIPKEVFRNVARGFVRLEIYRGNYLNFKNETRQIQYAGIACVRGTGFFVK